MIDTVLENYIMKNIPKDGPETYVVVTSPGNPCKPILTGVNLDRSYPRLELIQT